MSPNFTNLPQDEIQVWHSLYQAIGRATDFQNALAVALSRVCEISSWEYGEAWILSQKGTVLELSPAWCKNCGDKVELLALEQFRLCSEGFIFPPSVGLPGRVWSSQQPEWISDASAQSENFFLRNQIAKAFGVKAGFGVPVIAELEVRAVLVFLTFQDRDEDQKLVELAKVVAMQLGLFLVNGPY
ncbi:MAG: GAF domain-containing protein [Chroococcidiopsidaceae cyanobacterium CP_BM_ER_R8_30]|nr:GAF domain-containing protein [Chroococcidiopsidaceae cyanobacterium CP_BM_ER_R8_30]